MSLSKLDVFDLDLDSFAASLRTAQYRKHRDGNAPCNCHRCLVLAMVHGVIKCVRRDHPDSGEAVWVPRVDEDGVMLAGISPEGVRKVFMRECDEGRDTAMFAHLMIQNSWRASNGPVPADRVAFSDKVKRKRGGAGDGSPSKQANTALGAAEVMPATQSDVE